jgi:hypothetical protein
MKHLWSSHKSAFKITSIEQNRFHEGTIGLVRVVDRECGIASGGCVKGIREEDATGGEGNSG